MDDLFTGNNEKRCTLIFFTDPTINSPAVTRGIRIVIELSTIAQKQYISLAQFTLLVFFTTFASSITTIGKTLFPCQLYRFGKSCFHVGQFTELWNDLDVSDNAGLINDDHTSGQEPVLFNQQARRLTE